MAQVNGQMKTCDRCTTSVFLKCIGEGEMDGGYTRWNKFETPPEGWNFCEVGYKNSMLLCPNCFKQWQKINDNFLNPEECCPTSKSEPMPEPKRGDRNEEAET